MKEQLVTKKILCLAKKNGFKKRYFNKPTQSLLQKWLREVHQIYVLVNIDCTTYPKYAFDVLKFVGNPRDLREDWSWELVERDLESYSLYRTYEEALENGLEFALNLKDIK